LLPSALQLLRGRAAPKRHQKQAALRDSEVEASHLALPDKPSIAVLPFQNMSGDPEQDYFTDGMVEDIITTLSRFRHLFVIARNSSFTYKVAPLTSNRSAANWGALHT